MVEHVYSGKESMEKVLTAVSEEAAKLKELYEKLKSEGITVERLWDCQRAPVLISEA